ncbi:MAG: hypothetical protein H6613_13800 [Ignavibacteriales bacterium]|nr:hypothetical protein [Ignavibacteriales bacterium]
MKVNGTSYNCPTQDFGVVEQNQISFLAEMYVVQNGIGYLFNHWDDGNTSSYRTVNPTVHKTYTAYYVGKADNAYRGLSINSSDPTGTPVRLTWNQHPNTNITKYEIWRKVGFNITAIGYKIATINRSSASTYTYTDNEYSISHVINKDNEVSYDVKAYYSVENTLSQDDYVVTYGTPEAKRKFGFGSYCNGKSC